MLFRTIFMKRSILAPLDPEEMMTAISKNDVDRRVVHETVWGGKRSKQEELNLRQVSRAL